MDMLQSLIDTLPDQVSQAVTAYWDLRGQQIEKQKSRGKSDQGARSATTGGSQMNGFIQLFTYLLTASGIETKYIYHQTALELPGYFRPTKKWDLLVVKDGKLLLALEAKSQVGPSFGNNFNNRAEEALGSALDLWTAYREGAFHNNSQPPFLGYFFMLEDCDKAKMPLNTQEPHFKVFPEFAHTSYEQRYEILCRKLIRERHYTAAAFITSDRTNGVFGKYNEPANDLNVTNFVRSFIAHVIAWRQ